MKWKEKLSTHNRNMVLIMLVILNISLFTACMNNTDRVSDGDSISQVGNNGDIANSIDSQGEEGKMTIDVKIGDKNFSGVLYENSSAQELYKRMPMKINMKELNGNEKFHYLSEALPTNSQQIGVINSGDIMLYGSDCLVLFYESFSTSYSYTKIGYIEDASQIKEILGKGSVEITLNASI